MSSVPNQLLEKVEERGHKPALVALLLLQGVTFLGPMMAILQLAEHGFAIQVYASLALLSSAARSSLQ